MKSKAFLCGYCGKSVATKQSLNNHIKSSHKNANYFELTDN